MFCSLTMRLPCYVVIFFKSRVVERLAGIIEDVPVCVGSRGDRSSDLGVHLSDSHTGRIEHNCRSVSKLVARRNLKRNQNLVDRLFLGSG